MKIYLQDDAKAVLKDKFKILNAYIRKEERLKIHKLSIQLKKMGGWIIGKP